VVPFHIQLEGKELIHIGKQLGVESESYLRYLCCMKSATADAIAPQTRRVIGRPFQPGNCANPHGRHGRVRIDESERQCEVAAIIGDLGHQPSAVERLLIDELAALAVRARRLRRRGLPTDDVARLMTRIASKLAIKPGAKVKDAVTEAQARDYLARVASEGTP
jgi:hypothetical protein